MPDITRGRYYSSVMPIAGIAYLIVLIVTSFNVAVVLIGALVFGLLAVTGSAVVRPQSAGRLRNRG